MLFWVVDARWSDSMHNFSTQFINCYFESSCYMHIPRHILPKLTRYLSTCSGNWNSSQITLSKIYQFVVPRKIKTSTWWCIHTVVKELEVKWLLRLNTSLIQYSDITFRFLLIFSWNRYTGSLLLIISVTV